VNKIGHWGRPKVEQYQPMEVEVKKLVIAVSFLAAAMSTAFAQRYVRFDAYYGFGPGVRAHIIKVNAPGGAYIQCDARMLVSDALPTAGRSN
jgi:hypothetical protein